MTINWLDKKLSIQTNLNEEIENHKDAKKATELVEKLRGKFLDQINRSSLINTNLSAKRIIAATNCSLDDLFEAFKNYEKQIHITPLLDIPNSEDEINPQVELLFNSRIENDLSYEKFTEKLDPTSLADKEKLNDYDNQIRNEIREEIGIRKNNAGDVNHHEKAVYWGLDTKFDLNPPIDQKSTDFQNYLSKNMDLSYEDSCGQIGNNRN